MNSKSILMPHICQIVGWCVLAIIVLMTGVKMSLLHIYGADMMNTAGHMAKASHILLILSMFLICLSKEKVEDEMIHSLRLKATGITIYFFFILFMILSLVLACQPGFIYSHIDETSSLYINEFFLIFLPILLAGLYLIIYKIMLWKSKRQEAL